MRKPCSELPSNVSTMVSYEEERVIRKRANVIEYGWERDRSREREGMRKISIELSIKRWRAQRNIKCKSASKKLFYFYIHIIIT